MSLTDAYLTAAQFRARIGIVSSAEDTAIDATILAASRQIDNWCGRPFGKSAAAEARYFTLRGYGYGSSYAYSQFFGGASPSYGYPYAPLSIDVGDLVSVTEIATDLGDRTYPNVWDAADFDLYPVQPRPNWPFHRVESSPLGIKAFPPTSRGIRVTGIFGWPAVPAAIVEAATIQATRLWARRLAPLGLAGSSEFGLTAIANMDPDVRSLIAAYKSAVV